MFTETELGILRRLLRHKYVGKKHTPIDNVIKGVSSHEKKNAKKAIKNLIKKGYLIQKQTYHGIDISINTNKLKEIKEALGMT